MSCCLYPCHRKKGVKSLEALPHPVVDRGLLKIVGGPTLVFPTLLNLVLVRDRYRTPKWARQYLTGTMQHLPGQPLVENVSQPKGWVVGELGMVWVPEHAFILWLKK